MHTSLAGEGRVVHFCTGASKLLQSSPKSVHLFLTGLVGVMVDEGVSLQPLVHVARNMDVTPSKPIL